MSRETSDNYRDNRKLVALSEEGRPSHEETAPTTSLARQSSSASNRAPPRRMDHTYRDYSNFPTADLPVLKAPTNFPSKLHHILSDPEFQHVSRSDWTGPRSPVKFPHPLLTFVILILYVPYFRLMSFQTGHLVDAARKSVEGPQQGASDQ